MKVSRFFSSVKRGIDTTHKLMGLSGLSWCHIPQPGPFLAPGAPDPPKGLLSPPAALAAPTNSTAGDSAPPAAPALELLHQVKVYLWGKSCEPWAGSTGLIFYGIQVKHSRDCRGRGFVAQGLCQCSQGTWQQQQVFQAFPPSTWVPCCPRGALFYCWGHSCPPGHSTAP